MRSLPPARTTDLPRVCCSCSSAQCTCLPLCRTCRSNCPMRTRSRGSRCSNSPWARTHPRRMKKPCTSGGSRCNNKPSRRRWHSPSPGYSSSPPRMTPNLPGPRTCHCRTRGLCTGRKVCSCRHCSRVLRGTRRLCSSWNRSPRGQASRRRIRGSGRSDSPPWRCSPDPPAGIRSPGSSCWGSHRLRTHRLSYRIRGACWRKVKAG